MEALMQNVDPLGLDMLDLDVLRRKIAEADADPRPDLDEEDLDRHFAVLLREALAARRA
jgi:hypothetical protein